MFNKKARKIRKVSRKVLGLICSGSAPEVGYLSKGRMYVTVNGKVAYVFDKSDCVVDIPKLLDALHIGHSRSVTQVNGPKIAPPNKDKWARTLAELDIGFEPDVEHTVHTDSALPISG